MNVLIVCQNEKHCRCDRSARTPSSRVSQRECSQVYSPSRYTFYEPISSQQACYSKSQEVEPHNINKDFRRCMAHIPHLYLDVHNACIMPKMRQYVFLVDGLRELRCAYTRKVRVVGLEVRQLHMIMSQRCHGELVFTTDDCAALDRPPMSWSRK
ncbi:cytokine-like protein 1 isoform X1 [Oncorhynchus kisutch]|uniref:cytokine-like protein 1 isoform X1 n=1 Tax=Oncorhynchus kisutch TaxID=8019 RepID=UPI00099FFA08|nr:cytokine-like protein 1 isoform X1 [Oncorhynchus kisutch]